MPNRVIKDSIKRSPQIDSLTWFEEVVFFHMILTADDYGCLDGRTIVLKNDLFPTKETVTKKAIEEAVSKLVSVGLLRSYEVNGMPYLFFPTWEKHQRVRNKFRKYPELPPETSDCQVSAVCQTNDRQMSADCRDEVQSESESNPNMNPTDSCAEPFQASAPTVAVLPLLDGTDYGITQEEADKDAQAFPAVDVLQEYLKMERWLVSNPAKKKTRRGIRRFINAWLERAQNQGGTKGAAQQNAIHRGNYSENHDSPRTTYSIQPHFAGE